MLPEGWIKVSHNSGLPIYLHKTQRVCSISKPYFLGPGSVRKHEIPITAIPCLSYRRALEKEALLRASLAGAPNTNGESQSQGQDVSVASNETINTDQTSENSNGIASDNAVVETNGHAEEKSVVEVAGEASTDGAEGKDTANSNDTPETTAPAVPNADPPRPTKPLPGILGTAKIETVTENAKAQSLSPQQINEYCKNLFVFKKLRVMRFT